MQDKATSLQRRKAVGSRNPGIYYRPKPGGRKHGPPYEIAYRSSDGRQRWESGFPTVAAATTRRNDLKGQQARGEKIVRSRETLQEYGEAWLEKQIHLRPHTVRSYRWALENHIYPAFGHRRLGSITADDVSALIVALRKPREGRPEGYKGWTVRAILRPLSTLLIDAVRAGKIPNNPVAQLQMKERPKTHDERRHRVLTAHEAQALIAAADSERYRVMFLLLLSTGLRIGEALGLRVRDIQGDVIHVEQQISDQGNPAPLKTESSRRRIDVAPELTRALLALVDERGARFTPDALVFISAIGTAVQRKVVTAALKRAIDAAGIGSPAPTLHDLRHTHASMLIAHNVSIADVQQRLGHKDPSMTLSVYTHQWQEHSAKKSGLGVRVAAMLDGTAGETNDPHETNVVALPVAAKGP